MTEIKGYDLWLTDDHYTDRCEKCESKVNDESDLTEVSGGDMVCDSCLEDYFECSICKNYYKIDDESEVEEVCASCLDNYYKLCTVCGKMFNVEKSEHFVEDKIEFCDTCYKELEHI
jgi:hypothetical protein